MLFLLGARLDRDPNIFDFLVTTNIFFNSQFADPYEPQPVVRVSLYRPHDKRMLDSIKLFDFRGRGSYV